ncbi:MAG: response regulator [candidate division Zixibacteria bacterium]|nr:response regulator [candidate division Zixibacteria bacterium]
MTILIVDDDTMARKLIEKILVREGYRVLQADNGRAALELLEQTPVNIIVSDIRMPVMNGYDLLKAVKERFPSIPVILITAFGDTYSVRDGLVLGADEYITKPFKSHEIALVVERTYWRLLSGKPVPDVT